MYSSSNYLEKWPLGTKDFFANCIQKIQPKRKGTTALGSFLSLDIDFEERKRPFAKKGQKPVTHRVSLSQGSSPTRQFAISPGTRKRLRKRSSSNISNVSNSRKNTIEKILLYQELGKDVPIDIALKRVLLCAQRNDWKGCEQALG